MFNPRSIHDAFTVLFIGCAMLLATQAEARPEYAEMEESECSTCHVNPRGGGKHNLLGKYYHATFELPEDRSPETMAKVKNVVDAWMEKLLSKPPTVTWRYVPLEDKKGEPVVAHQRAPAHVILRRLSLDIRGTTPSAKDIKEVASGAKTLEEKTEEYLASKDFFDTFLLYHKDLLRPRSGDHNQTASLSAIRPFKYKGKEVWMSSEITGERERGECDPDKRVRVEPYWFLSEPIWVCASTANTADEVRWKDSNGKNKIARCDTMEGQKSGRCGCGPNLKYCFRPRKDYKLVMQAMKQEAARVAMELIQNDEPYSRILTADWSMMNGRLEHYYAKLAGDLGELDDPDTNRKWHRVERGEHHSGVISAPSYFNFYFNGRRWAQRTYEAFMCHETFPDFDLLDEQETPPFLLYRDHPESEPSPGVTEERACAACHLQLDSLARVKDRWDPFGQYYPKFHGAPIPQSADFQGQIVDGVDGFGKALAESDIFKDCVVNQLWDHFAGHRFKPSELETRRELLRTFKDSNLNFKEALRAVTRSDKYRALGTLKLMTRETYRRAMGRITGVKWRVDGRAGFNVFYDKVGGMDYRKIEARDRTPGIGHSMVQYKAAAESCEIAVERDYKYSPKKRKMLRNFRDLDAPSPKEVRKLLEDWFLRIYARPAEYVGEQEFKLLTELFYKIRKNHSERDGYKAVCTVMFGSEDFAIF